MKTKPSAVNINVKKFKQACLCCRSLASNFGGSTIQTNAGRFLNKSWENEFFFYFSLEVLTQCDFCPVRWISMRRNSCNRGPTSDSWLPRELVVVVISIACRVECWFWDLSSQRRHWSLGAVGSYAPVVSKVGVPGVYGGGSPQTIAKALLSKPMRRWFLNLML